MQFLGSNRWGQHKVRLNLAGGLNDQWQEIIDTIDINRNAVDSLWHNLDNIEIDVWIDGDGKVTVDGAW